jgi:DNA adenine methylase
MPFLPKNIKKVIVPPLKCQGIKTKLVPFIAKSIEWNGNGKWIEPFLGSGVVAFNILPVKALLSDTNKHIIQLYQKIQRGEINRHTIREMLFNMGAELEKRGEEYYYEIRNRFNQSGNSYDFVFLNRSCFNGLMRFNRNGGFNVPFGHKPKRFSKAYITKITNQVNNIATLMTDKEWHFIVADWRETLTLADENDFVYLDPPYAGRHTDYFNTWSEQDAIELSEIAGGLPCPYALSMWLENRYRKNAHIEDHWGNTEIKTISHFYHVGSTESLRNAMTEALVLKQNIPQAL